MKQTTLRIGSASGFWGDSEFAAAVEQMLNDDFALADEVAKEESREIHRLQQVGMRIARLISPIL